MSGGVAQIAGGIVGAVVGSFFAMPALGYALGSALAGAAVAASAEGDTVEGPRLTDTQVQSSSYGRFLPVVYGTYATAGNVIWLEDNEIKETRHEEDVGGKGGPSTTQVTYTYSASFAVSLCEGEIAGVRRIWADSILLYDGGADASAERVAASAEGHNGIRIHRGTATQEPDPRIEAALGVGATPAYRHTAYMVIEDLALERFGNRLPNLRAEVVAAGSDKAMGLTRWSPDFLIDYPNQYEGARYNDGIVEISDWEPIGDQLGDPQLLRHFLRRYTLDGARLDDDKSAIIAVPDNNPYSSSTGIHFSANEPRYFVIASGATKRWVYRDQIGGRVYAPTLPDQDGTYDGFAIDDVWVIHNDRAYAHGRKRIDREGEDLFYLHYIACWPPLTLGGALFASHPSAYITAEDLGLKRDKKIRICPGADGALYVAGRDDANNERLVRLSDDLAILETWPSLPHVDTELNWVNGRRYMAIHLGNALLHEMHDDNSGATLIEESDSIDTPSVGSHYVLPLTTGLAITYSGTLAIGDFITPGTTTVATVLGDLAARAGIAAGDIDTSALTQTLDGYAITRLGPLRAAIEPLRPAYQFDLAEIDYRITAVARGGAPVATLGAGDLSAHELGQERPPALAATRALESALPRRVHVEHADPATDYEVGHQYAGRITTAARDEQRLRLALVLGADAASRIADIVLREAWTARTSYGGPALSARWAALTPTDVIDVVTPAGTARLRLTEIDDGRPGLRECRAVAESAALYTSSAVGQSGTAPVDRFTLPGPTELALLDVPLLVDSDDTPGYYAAASGLLAGWRGAALYRSSDGGQTYQSIEPLLLRAATMGHTTATLAPGPSTIWDEGSTINVELASGELASATELAVLNGANALAIEAAGGWEIVQFQNATLEGDGTTTLSRLLRGRRGSEWAIAEHGPRDRVVALTSDGALRRAGATLDHIAAAREHKAVSLGSSVARASAQTFTYAAVSLTPLAPAHLTGERDGAGDLTLRWVRRTRFGGEWRDGTDATLDEPSEAYEVDVLDDTGAVVRTLAGLSTAQAVYTATQQTEDFGAAQASVSVRVYQISARVGRGYATEATL